MEQRIGWELALASLCLAFALSLMVAWTYTRTHAGLSYLRSFTQSLAVGGVIATVVMMAIGDDVARGLGVVGALTIVRFRTNLKDTRDLMFVFASLAAGVSCGVQSFAIAIIGTLVFVAACLFLWRSDFGSRRQFDAVLRICMTDDPAQGQVLSEVLERYCRRAVLLNVRQTGSNLHEHSYQLELSDRSARGPLLNTLDSLPGFSGVTLLMQDSTVEP